MGLTKTSDGRYLVGLGIEDVDNYKGSQGYRDLVIQLTADGATDASFEKLNYLRDYAIYHSGQGNPVMPPSVSVWISNNGTTTAVEADDISLTDGVYTICGIKYENGAWDFTNAGQGGGGGSSLPEVTSEDNGDVLTVIDGVWDKAPAPSSLPPYTSADKGKGLFLAEDAEHLVEKVVVPEQTGTTASLGVPGFYGFVLEDADTSFFENTQEGDECVVYIETIGGAWNERTFVYTTDPNTGLSMFAHGSGGTLTVLGMLNENVVFAGTAEDFTVTVKATASVPSVAPAWVSGGGALIVKATGECTYTPQTLDDPAQWSVSTDKTSTEVLAAMMSGTPVFLSMPRFTKVSPYYEYLDNACLMPQIDNTSELTISDNDYNNAIADSIRLRGIYYQNGLLTAQEEAII